MKKVILLFILFMLPSTSVFAASSVVAIKEKEIVAIDLEENNKVITLNKGEDFLILKSLIINNLLLTKI